MRKHSNVLFYLSQTWGEEECACVCVCQGDTDIQTGEQRQTQTERREGKKWKE